MAIFITSEREN